MPVHQAARRPTSKAQAKASTEFEVVNVTLVELSVANPAKVMVTEIFKWNILSETHSQARDDRARDDGLGSRHSDTGGRQALGVQIQQK